MRPIIYRFTEYAVTDADEFAADQAISALTPMTLALQTADFPRPLVFTSADDESDNRFLIRGNNQSGKRTEEVVIGVDNGTFETETCWSFIDEIIPEIDGSGNVQVGTLTAVPSPWFPLNWVDTQFNVDVNVILGGGITLSTGFIVQGTTDRLEHPKETRNDHNPYNRLQHPITSRFGFATASTAATRTNITQPITAVRVLNGDAIASGEYVEIQIVQGHRS